jgi:hypothetical protein
MSQSAASDPHAWMRPYFADVSRRSGFGHLSIHHQFAALLDAVAVAHPARAATLREASHATQIAILSALADVARVQMAASDTELWRVSRLVVRCAAWQLGCLSAWTCD